MDRGKKIYLILVVIVLIIIWGIYAYKNFIKEAPLDKLMKCIASKSVLYTSTGCSHCENQKEILGKSIGYFKNIDCLKEPDKCEQANIHAYPTWIINEKKYEGAQSIKKLTELSGCENCSAGTSGKNIIDIESCNGTDKCMQAIDSSSCSVGGTK